MTNLFLTYGITVLSIGIFTFIFIISYKFSNNYIPIFRQFTSSEKAEWCSRINSTVHAFVIVTGILYSLSQQTWDFDLKPVHSIDLSIALFSIAIGYFLFDLFIIIKWTVPLWSVFVAHHCLAVIPYMIFNFFPGCERNDYLLSLFLIVEMAVLPLNITTFIEQLGYGNTNWHGMFFYLTYIIWCIVRVFLPIYIIYILWYHYLLPIMIYKTLMITKYEIFICMIPATICGHCIAAFCIGIFIFIWTPDILAKWRKKAYNKFISNEFVNNNNTDTEILFNENDYEHEMLGRLASNGIITAASSTDNFLNDTNDIDMNKSKLISSINYGTNKL